MTANRRKTICLDFDGVIHKYTELTGEVPKNEMIDSMYEFITGQILEYNLIICLTRNATEVACYMSDKIPDITFLVTDDKMFCYDKVHHDVIGVTNVKPVADLYVDDRAVPFVNTDSLYEMIDYLEEI